MPWILAPANLAVILDKCTVIGLQASRGDPESLSAPGHYVDLPISTHSVFERGVAGFAPGPRCADQGYDTDTIVTTGTLPGFGPGPRCAPTGIKWITGREDAGVAGVRPRPSLREATPTVQATVNYEALPGSAPALVARSCVPDRDWQRDRRRCRGSTPALVARSMPRTADADRAARRCRGSTPALVARSSGTETRGATTGQALPGFGPGPRCADTARRPNRYRQADVAGFVPGPRCANHGRRPAAPARRRCRGSASALVARGCTASGAARSAGATLPGFDPGPRCVPRRSPAAWHPVFATVAGVRPRPSLRAAPADLDPGGQRGVAGVRPRPSLRGRPVLSAPTSPPEMLPGFGPGPRCVTCTSASRSDRPAVLPESSPGLCRAMDAWAQPDAEDLGSCRVRYRPSSCDPVSLGGPHVRALPGFGPGSRCAKQFLIVDRVGMDMA